MPLMAAAESPSTTSELAAARFAVEHFPARVRKRGLRMRTREHWTRFRWTLWTKTR